MRLYEGAGPESKRGLSLTEVLLAMAILLAAFFPIASLLTHDRAGLAALDRELQATASATAVLEYLETLPYSQVPLTPGTEPLQDGLWDSAHLSGPAGSGLAGQFPALSGGPLSRSLTVVELKPWPGSSRPVKLATVVVNWRQPAPGKVEREGRVILKTLLSPAREFDSSKVVEP